MTRKFWLASLLLLVGSFTAFAEEIEVPEEELARETTLPVFDKRRAVLNRTVLTSERFEAGGGFGLEMNEPFYNDYMFNFQGTYNFDEINSLNILGLFWMDGLSSYGDQLKAGVDRNKDGDFADVNDVQPFDASNAPHPVWGLFANYQFIAYYGKISISKLGVMNLNLFGVAGLGYINMDSANAFALNLGAGQNFFFTKNFGLRLDLRWLIYMGPDASLPQGNNPSATTFEDKVHYNGQIGLAGIFIL